MFAVLALLVCLVIVILCIEEMITAPSNRIIGALFIRSTISLVIGLGYFLRDVYLASNTLKIREP